MICWLCPVLRNWLFCTRSWEWDTFMWYLHIIFPWTILILSQLVLVFFLAIFLTKFWYTFFVLPGRHTCWLILLFKISIPSAPHRIHSQVEVVSFAVYLKIFFSNFLNNICKKWTVYCRSVVAPLMSVPWTKFQKWQIHHRAVSILVPNSLREG